MFAVLVARNFEVPEVVEDMDVDCMVDEAVSMKLAVR